MPQIVSREDWLTERKRLLEDEKAFTRARDALSARRRALPWVKVEKDYRFQTIDGEKTLADLFGPHGQLVTVHFMYGPDWQEGCPSCSMMADNYSGIDVHLAARNTALVAVSNAPLEKISAYKARMGWDFEWVSSMNTDFNQDFDVTFGDDELASGAVYYNYHETRFPSAEAPGISVFHKPEPDSVVHTYSTYGRGLDMLIGSYHFLDLTPNGRDEEALDFPMAWVRRRDQYET